MKLFTQQATLTTPSVSVYEKADSSSTTVGHLILGNTFDLEETMTAEDGSTWYRVTLPNGIEGYIQGEFTTGQEQQTEKTTENGTYVQTLVSANVRAEADINSANIGKVDVHQKISVLDEVQDVNGESWYLIEGDFDGDPRDTSRRARQKSLPQKRLPAGKTRTRQRRSRFRRQKPLIPLYTRM